MEKQLDVAQELCLNNEILRDLLATEIMLIGGGDLVHTTY